MMIKFKNVRLKNFLGFGNKFTEVCLDSDPSTVIIGPSGVGKSTIAEAISFALFGKTLRPINKAQLINTINGSECLVEIDFRIGHTEFTVRRGMKPNIFEIYQDDVLLNQDSHTKDYQGHLEKQILKLNYKTFSHIIVLCAVNFVPFMELKPADRRLLVEDLLDIEIFSVMNALLKDECSSIRNDIAANVIEINTHKERIELYSKYVDDLKKNQQQTIDDNLQKIELNYKQITEEENEILKLNTYIEELALTISDEKEIIEKLTQLLDLKRSIESNLKKLRKDLLFYQDNDACPTCERPFDETYKEEVLGSKYAKTQEFIAATETVEKRLSKLQTREDEISSVNEEIKSLKKEAQKHQGTILAIGQYIQKIVEENDSLAQKNADVSSEEIKIKELDDRLAELETTREKLINDKVIHELASNLLRDGGIKAKIIKQYLPIINKLVNRFLNSMNFYITFSIDENFKEIIRNRGQNDFTYFSLSEGERQRLDIAILLTWRAIAMMKNSINTNLLFIDEILDSSLDQIATENIIELITTEPVLKNSNIFVITHKTTMVDKFSRYIKFEKHKNFSRIVE